MFYRSELIELLQNSGEVLFLRPLLSIGWADYTRLAITLAGLTSMALNPVSVAQAQTQAWQPTRQPELPANELVRKVVENEIQAQQTDRGWWVYHSHKQEPGSEEVRQVVRTKQGTLHILISRNGQPLTAEQRQKEQERMQDSIAHPEERAKKQHERREDGERAKKLLEMLPDVFLFSYDGRDRELLALKFEPNPNFHPPSREAEVFHKMQGTMWISERQQRLAQLEGCLSEPVRFAGGLLGHLDKGGTFKVVQTEVSPRHWEPSLVMVSIHGKAVLFKTIHLQQTESMSRFHRIPDNTTLHEAAQILEKDGAGDPQRPRQIAQRPR